MPLGNVNSLSESFGNEFAGGHDPNPPIRSDGEEIVASGKDDFNQ